MPTWDLSSPNATSLVLKGKEAWTLSSEARIYTSEVFGVCLGEGGVELGIGAPEHAQ